MSVGDRVRYRKRGKNNVCGIILKTQGRKWLVIRWADGVTLLEHISDLKKIA